MEYVSRRIILNLLFASWQFKYRSILNIISRMNHCPRLKGQNRISSYPQTCLIAKKYENYPFFFYSIIKALESILFRVLWERSVSIRPISIYVHRQLYDRLKCLKRLRATFKVRDYLLEVFRRIIKYLYSRPGSFSFPYRAFSNNTFAEQNNIFHRKAKWFFSCRIFTGIFFYDFYNYSQYLEYSLS